MKEKTFKLLYKYRGVIAFFLMGLGFFLMSFWMNIYTKKLIDLKFYGFTSFKYKLIYLFFDFSWIVLNLLIIYIAQKKKRIKVYYFLNILWLFIFFAQTTYANEMGKFMIFSDIFVAGEGIHYLKSILSHLDIGSLVVVTINIFIMIAINRIYKTIKSNQDKKSKILIVALIILLLSFRLSAFIVMGKASGQEDTWKQNYYARSIYYNYTNPNTSMYISGLFEYNLRSVYKFFYNYFTLDKEKLKKEIDEISDKYRLTYEENDYTNIFKDKNIIYIMMESIDTWVIDEDTMPTLKKLQNEGINFTNRYSPFFNGGQTINSEFACNAGMYAISNRKTIYSIENVDYKYSLPNMLKRKGYVTASFHANTGKFYNRRIFHKKLGFDNHYSALDMQKANILDEDTNYFKDSSLVLDDYYYNLIRGNNHPKFFSFITTYSAHLPYDESNRVYKSIENRPSKKYNEEEYIYRLLAHDTDEFIRILIEKLEKDNILDDTVLVFVSDHYVYGYSDSEYVAYQKGVEDEHMELQNTPFIIWSKDIEHKDINIILDTADILPTLLNMLGIKYDPNKYLGEDLFSNNHDDFVWFSDGDVIKGNNILDDDYIRTKAHDNINKNKNILLTNYYGH